MLPTAHDVIDAEYEEIFDFSSAITLRQCKAADKKNRQIYAKRTKLAAEASEAGTVCNPEALTMPSVTNEQRYRKWRHENTPVRADWQASAVEKMRREDRTLHDNGYSVTSVSLIEILPPLPFAEIEVTGDYSGYTVFTVTELENRTIRECQAADARNHKNFTRRSRQSVSLQSKLSTASWARPCILSATPPPSNVQRKAALMERRALVSAMRQAAAVERLWNAGLRAGVDYRPQDAIATAENLHDVIPSAPPFYPNLDEEEGMS